MFCSSCVEPALRALAARFICGARYGEDIAEKFHNSFPCGGRGLVAGPGGIEHCRRGIALHYLDLAPGLRICGKIDSPAARELALNVLGRIAAADAQYGMVAIFK